MKVRVSLRKKIALLVLCVTVTFTVFAVELEIDTYQKAGHRDSKWDSLVEKGFKVYQGENFTEAYTYFKQAYSLGCRDGLVLYRLAFCCLQKGECTEAIFYGEEAETQLKRQYPEHRYNHSVYYVLARCTDDDERSANYYLRVLEAIPSDIDSRLSLSDRLIKLKRLEEAEKHINIVLQNYPQNTSSVGFANAYNGLGRICYQRGDYQQALSFLKKALEYREHGLEAWWLAHTYEALQDYKQAGYYWEKAANLYGKDSHWGREALSKLEKCREKIKFR